MKRIFKIFSIHFQDVITDRSRSFVWVLSSIAIPLIMILFWKDVTANSSESLSGWIFRDFASYYLLLTVTASFVIAHVEEVVAKTDIKQGELVNYILKPFSYYWMKFYQETPYRLFQGSLGVIVFFLVYTFFSDFLSFTNSFFIMVLSLILIVLGYMICFSFKTVLGLIAFWLIDIGGIFQFLEVVLVVFGGFIISITLFNPMLEKIVYFTPFPYMVYFPVLALIGKLSLSDISKIMLLQLIWLIIFFFTYKILWKTGLKKFTAVGQ